MSFLSNAFAGILNLVFEYVYKFTSIYPLGITIIIFTLIVKFLLLPLTIKQHTSAKKMQVIQPKLKALQDKYKNKKDLESQQAMSKELQELYSQHGTSPFSGCLPVLIQFPIIITLFKVLRGATTYISRLSNIYTDLSAKIIEIPKYKELLNNFIDIKKLRIENLETVENVKSALSNLTDLQWSEITTKLSATSAQTVNSLLQTKNAIENFFSINLINTPSWSNISFILPLFTAITMYVITKATSKMNNTNTDNKNDNNQMQSTMKTMSIFMPILIFFTCFSLPAGLCLYWLLGNLFTLLTQYLLNKFSNENKKDGAN